MGWFGSKKIDVKPTKYVFKLPDIYDGVVEAEIVDWKVKAGDSVTKGQSIMDVGTDKATLQLSSPVSGGVISTTGKPGDMVLVGTELIVFHCGLDKDEWVIARKQIAEHHIELDEFDEAIDIYEEMGEMKEVVRVQKIIDLNILNKKKIEAKTREDALDYEAAIEIWEELGDIKEAARVRKLKAEQGAVKVDQTVVHGDYIDDRDTIVKDSVVSKSSIGGGSSKMQELEKLTEMKKEGLIDDAEFQQMKKEILGK